LRYETDNAQMTDGQTDMASIMSGS